MMLKQKNKSLTGFTLIELLVVIAIIGILATIVLVSLNNARQKARDVKRVGDMRQLQLALEGYYDDILAYPGGDGVATTCSGVAAELTPLVPTYISALPTDPGGGSVAYAYDAGAIANGQDYVLRAQIESTTQTSLATDIDGASVFGCNCADNNGVDPDANRFFCVQP